MRERCEAHGKQNSDAEKELDELRTNVKALRYLQKMVDGYGRPSILAAQIEKLKVSFADEEKHCKKIYEDAVEACQAFEADQKYL